MNFGKFNDDKKKLIQKFKKVNQKFHRQNFVNIIKPKMFKRIIPAKIHHICSIRYIEINQLELKHCGSCKQKATVDMLYF